MTTTAQYKLSQKTTTILFDDLSVKICIFEDLRRKAKCSKRAMPQTRLQHHPHPPSSIHKVQASSAEEILKFWSRNGMLFSCNGGSRLHANHATLMRSVFPELSYNFQWTVFRSASLVLESLEFSLSPWLFHPPYSRPSLCHPYCMIR